ncbi:MAG: DUF4926 domain-containing protein [Acidobacteriaceae bacterium]
MNLYDVVALTTDLPAHELRRGQVGTIVEQLAPGVFEVEFANLQGEAYALLSVISAQLMVLHHQPIHTAA